MKKADRYLKVVEWSEDKGCYVGSCPGLIARRIQGDNEIQVYEELCLAVAKAVESCEADGKALPPATANRKYSGRFLLRVDKELHRQIAIKALHSGESLNSFCQKVLKKAVDERP